MSNHNQYSDNELISLFEARQLPSACFNHEAHLRIAWIHIQNSGPELAGKFMSRQILQYASSLGAKEKYNETVTIAAVKAMNHFMEKSCTTTFSALLNEFPKLKTHFKELLNSHYSFDIFNSAKAQKKYLKPDLIPF